MKINEIDMNELEYKFYTNIKEDPFYAVRATEYLMLLPKNITFAEARDNVSSLIEQYAKNKIYAIKPLETVSKGLAVLYSIFAMTRHYNLEIMTVDEILKLIENYANN